MTPEMWGPMFWLVIKLFTLLGLGIYVIFTGVVVRQEQLMSKVLEAGPERILRVLAWIYLLCAVGIFGLAIILL